VVWNRGADGSLTSAGSYATGGRGSGAGLGSQGAIILSQNSRWLSLQLLPGADGLPANSAGLAAH
jgi:hypothetical protein